MFWAYNTNSPQIDIILCKEDLTLQELLDQENVLQELKAQNLKLIEFLLKPEILHELVSLITTEPSAELEETEQYKYPNLACELLTSDLPAINERLASEEILNKLYSFLENDPPLNPLLSSYFSRTLSILIGRKSEQNWYSYQYTCLQALEFLKEKEAFIELLFKHMGTSSIMDLMHNLITLIEGPELKQSLRSWLQNQNVIPNLVSLLSPNVDADCQVNAASALCSIIQKLRENVAELNEKPESDPILNLLESTHTIELVLSTAFNSETVSEISIESAIEVLMTLMQPHLPGESRCRRMLHYSVHDKLESGLTAQNTFTETMSAKNFCPTLLLSDIIMAVLPYIKKMKEILQNPIKTDPITLTNGVVSPPFGRSRLVVAKFIAVLISLNNTAINKEIILCDIPELLLDLFYAYSSNNFLHTEVEKLIAYAIDNLNGYTVTDNNDDIIFIHLLKKCNLLQRLVDMWKENAVKENEGKFRRGYMGHVIRIASFIHIEDSKMSNFHDLLIKEVTESCLNDWNTVVNEHLKFIIELHSSCLGGIRPRSCQSSDNSFEESSYKEPKSTFREYDPDEDQNTTFVNDSSTIPYGLNNDVMEDEQERQSEMFNAICSQKWPSFVEGLDDIDENESEKNDRMNVWKTESKMDGDIRVWGSDDEYGDEDRENTSDPWSKLGNVSDPWANSSLNSSDESNWNVDSSWANFDENFTGGAPSAEPSPNKSSSLPTNVGDSYSLFGSSGSEKSLLDKFSNIMILSDELREDPFSCIDTNLANGGEWRIADDENDGAASVENSGSSYSLSSQFNCFGGGQEKDSSEEMLDLESICGNTLAEKIANAEHDIRSKDEIRMRGLQEQQQCLHREFVNAGSCQNDGASVTSKENGHAGRCEEKHVSGYQQFPCGDHSVEGDANIKGNSECLSDECCAVGSLPADCLTENSVDFVTAENNSTSDAESSVEFGDADNSLEFDDEEAEDATCDRTAKSATEAVTPAAHCDLGVGTLDTGSDLTAGQDATADISERVATSGSPSAAEASCKGIAKITSGEEVAADVNGASTTGTSSDAVTDGSNAVAIVESSKDLPKSANDCDMGKVLCENVPTKEVGKFGERCNSGATELENDPTTTDAITVMQKTHSLANGDVADSDILLDCDTQMEEASSGCSSISEQSDKNTGNTIITDPA